MSKCGISTQSREKSISILQERNVPPLQVISKLRKEGVPEKDIPSTRQIKNLKTSLKNDHSETSKHRLLTLSDLKHYFEAKLVTSKENYALLGEELSYPVSSCLSALFNIFNQIF